MSTDQPFYSIRMRASVTAQHLSGAERIVSKPELDQTISDLRSRAMSKAQEPDRIIITIESLHNMSISRLQALPITTVPSKNVDESRDLAVRKLELAGVSANVAESALALLDNGAAASGMNMRGALIMTAGEGKRLEPDRERGVRVSRFDWSTEAQPVIEQQLATAGLGHFRTREALALATKVAHAPGIIAELCWSDDPDYTAGYVASLSRGYIRFPMLKPLGHGQGGRVFFVADAGFDLAPFLDFLEKQPVFIDTVSR